jgi:hypothetical protein
MKKIFLLIFSLVCTHTYAQEQKKQSSWKNFVKDRFVNYTDLGVLFGKSYQINNSGTNSIYGYYNYGSQVQASARFTLQTYNGLRVYKNLSVGATLGVDWFNQYQIVPVSLGLRVSSGDAKSKKVKTFAGIDAGYGMMLLNEKTSDNQQLNGGLSLSPMVGLLIPTGGNANFTFSVGYKHNEFNTKIVSGVNEYLYSNETTYNLNRMAVRLGVNF